MLCSCNLVGLGAEMIYRPMGQFTKRKQDEPLVRLQKAKYFMVTSY